MSAPRSALPATDRSLSQDLRSPGRSQVFTTASGDTSFGSLHPDAHDRACFTRNAIAGSPNRSKTVGERAAPNRGFRTVPNLGDVEYYVWRMLKFAAKRPALTIWCWKHAERPSLHLFILNGVINVLITLKRTESQREQAVREIFEQDGRSALQDEITGGEGNESRSLLYAIPGTAPQAAHVIAEFFRKCYGLAENAELEYNYRERKAA